MQTIANFANALRCSLVINPRGAAAAAVALGLLLGASSAFAQNNVWQGDDTVDPTDWFDADNWSLGTPTTTSDLRFSGGSVPHVMDFHGSDVTVDDISFGNFSASTGQTTAGSYDPAIFKSTGGSGVQTLKFNEFEINERGSDIQFDVKLDGQTFSHTRKPGDVTFNQSVEIANLLHQKGRRWFFSGDATFSGGVKLEWANMNIGGNSPRFFANSTIDTPAIEIGDGGEYWATVDGGMGNSNTVIDIASGGQLVVQSSQSGAGTVNVNTGAAGDTGGPTPGVTEGYALFDAAGINLTNLSLNTPFVAGTSGAEISAGSQVIVSGTLSGAGAWGGDGVLTVAGTGTVSPGNSIDTMTGANLNFADGATYDFEIADPDSTPGTGWDLIDVGDLSFDGDWTLNVIDFGLTRDIDPSEEFLIAMMDSTNFDPANASITTPQDWFVGPDALFLDNDGNLVLTNVSNVAQAVPEPQSLAIWALLGLTLAGFGYYRSRRKSS